MIEAGAKQFARKLSSVHPLLYLFAYILVIPLFAAIYFVLPTGSFYAPYLRWEPTTTDDFLHAQHIIETSLNRSISSRTILIRDWRLDRLSVYGLHSDDGSIFRFDILDSFKNSSSGTSPAAQVQERVGIDLPVLMPTGGATLIGARPDQSADVLRPIFINNSAYPEGFRAIQDEFYVQLLPTPFPPAGRGLALSRGEDAELRELFDGLKGNPIAISSAFPRMLYFSAIVITTVGFGDIVPMTSSARFLVALQAILGVSLAGLFLNALAHRASSFRRG